MKIRMKKKEDFIVFKNTTRNNVLSDAVMSFLDYVYSISYPKPDKTFTEMCKIIKEKSIEKCGRYDRNFHIEYGRYTWPFDFYYIPEKVLREIYNNYCDAYHIKQYWKEGLEELIHFLFVKPGLKEVYSPTEWSDDKPLRHCVDAKLLQDVIGEESSEKVKEILEDYKNTYRFGLIDVNTFSAAYLSTPTSNKENVKEAWKIAFNKDIDVPDDSMWINNYEMEDLIEDGEIEE